MLDDPEVDALYALPLGDFVAARNALVKDKKKLAPDVSEEIKKLQKPSASAWVINQLMRRRGVLVKTLLSAIDRVRAVQLAALNGGTDLSLREAMKEEKEVYHQLLEIGPVVLADLVGAPNEAAVEKALKALHAAALDAEGRALLERGRLDHDYEEPGFGGLVGPAPDVALAPSAGTLDARRRAEDLRSEEERRHAARKKLEAAAAELETQRNAELRLLAELQGAERTLAEAKRKHEEAERFAEQKRAQLEEVVKQRREIEARIAALNADSGARPLRPSNG